MAFDPSIIMGYRGMGELPNPMNQLAQVSQIQSAQRQGEAAQMQLEDLKNDRIEMQKFQAELVANGGNPDLKVLAQTMLRSPKTRGEGIELMQKLNQQAQFETVGKKLYPELFGAEPTAAAPVAAPTAAPAPSIMRQPGVAPAVPVAPNALGTGMYGMEPTAPVNALAPTTAPAAAPVNALAAPTGKTVDQLRREIIMFSQSTDPRAKAMVDMLKAQLTEASKTAPDAVLMQKLGYPLTQAGYQAFRDAQRQERMLTPAEEEQRIRIANASRPPRAEAALRTQQVTMSDGTLGIMNMDTGTVTPANVAGAPVKGKPSAFAEKAAAQKVQMGKDLNFAITQLSDITKDGGLIDQSTGSGAGRLADVGAGFFGQATKGAIAIGQIAPIADLVLKMVPRFEGPQSDKDTASYKQAAGQLADPTLPTKIRKEAGKTVLRLMKERQGQFVTNDMATEGVGPVTGGVVDYGSLK